MAISVFEGAVLADLVYKFGVSKKSEKTEHDCLTKLGNWSRVFWRHHAHTGFQGAVFTNVSELVVAYRGSSSDNWSEFKHDWLGADSKILFRKQNQNHDSAAQELYD